MTSPPPYRYPAPPPAEYGEKYTAAAYAYGHDPHHQPAAPVAEDHNHGHPDPDASSASGGHVDLPRTPTAEAFYQNAQIPQHEDTSSSSAPASYYYPGADYYQHHHPERPRPEPEYHRPYSDGAYHGHYPQESPYTYPPHHDTWHQAAHPAHPHAQWSGQADPRQAHVYQQSAYGHYYPAAPYYAYPPATAYSYPPPPGSSHQTAARSNNKRNIDAASDSQEEKNSPKKKKKKKMYSQFVGVTFNRTHNKYQACITHYRKQHYLGRYKLAADAALAYDESARLLKGPNWKTNFTTRDDYELAKEREIEQVSRKSGTKPRSSIHTVAMKVEEVAEKIGYAGAGRAAVLNPPVLAHRQSHHPCSVGEPNQYYYNDFDRHGVAPSSYGPDAGAVSQYEGEETKSFKNPVYEADPSSGHEIEGKDTTPDGDIPQAALTSKGNSSNSTSTGSEGNSQWNSRRGTVIQNGTLAAASALLDIYRVGRDEEGDKSNTIEST